MGTKDAGTGPEAPRKGRPRSRLVQRVSTLQKMVGGAREFRRAYVRRRKVDNRMLSKMAEHALRLGLLGSGYRAPILSFILDAKVHRSDRDELVKLIEHVPWREFCGTPLLLNPEFGKASDLIKGADADLIVGNRLVELKATQDANVERCMVRQLIGYAILSRLANRCGEQHAGAESAPSLLFVRHGHLWTLPAGPVQEHPEFPTLEEWFIDSLEGRQRPWIAPRDESLGPDELRWWGQIRTFRDWSIFGVPEEEIRRRYQAGATPKEAIWGGLGRSPPRWVLECGGERKTLHAWATATKIPAKAIVNSLNQGHSPERALGFERLPTKKSDAPRS